jgi:integral membrane protein
MTATPAQSPSTQPGAKKRPLLVSAYVFFAWATGVMIVLLVFVTVPLKYWGSVPGPEEVVGLVHGVFLYPPYVILSIATAFVYRLSIPHMALMALAGLVPGLSPYVAGRTVKHIEARQAAQAAKKLPGQSKPKRPVDSPVGS